MTPKSKKQNIKNLHREIANLFELGQELKMQLSTCVIQSY